MTEEKINPESTPGERIAAEAFRTHMQEILKNDYTHITLTIGEWHWAITARGERLPQITDLVLKTMRRGFQIAKDEEEYVAKKDGIIDHGYG